MENVQVKERETIVNGIIYLKNRLQQNVSWFAMQYPSIQFFKSICRVQIYLIHLTIYKISLYFRLTHDSLLPQPDNKAQTMSPDMFEWNYFLPAGLLFLRQEI